MPFPDRILFIDTETGGLDPLRHSLLSIGLVVWENLEILDEKEILINDGRLIATDEALSINGIDLDDHAKHALDPASAIVELNSFVRLHYNAGELITLAGHNVCFDISFLKHFLHDNNIQFGRLFSHRSIDTSSILYYLYLSGKLKVKAISSSEAFEHFGITVEGRHTALGDARATAQLFSLLINLYD